MFRLLLLIVDPTGIDGDFECDEDPVGGAGTCGSEPSSSLPTLVWWGLGGAVAIICIWLAVSAIREDRRREPGTPGLIAEFMQSPSVMLLGTFVVPPVILFAPTFIAFAIDNNIDDWFGRLTFALGAVIAYLYTRWFLRKQAKYAAEENRRVEAGREARQAIASRTNEERRRVEAAELERRWQETEDTDNDVQPVDWQGDDWSDPELRGVESLHQRWHDEYQDDADLYDEERPTDEEPR